MCDITRFVIYKNQLTKNLAGCDLQRILNKTLFIYLFIYLAGKQENICQLQGFTDYETRNLRKQGQIVQETETEQKPYKKYV